MSGRLGSARALAYASGTIGVEILAPILLFLPYFYAPPADAGPGTTVYLSAATVGALLFVGRFLDGFAEPIVGYLSDRTRTRFGRRRPYVWLGTPVLCATYFALFHPPFGSGRPVATGVYLCLVNTLYWCAFTAVVQPYLALLPEVAATTEERTRISVWMTAFTILVQIAANLVVGEVIADLRGGGELLGFRFENGYTPQVLLYAALAVIFFAVATAAVRERPEPDGRPDPLSFRASIAESVRNPAFLPLVAPMSVFLIGVNLISTAVPYLSRSVLGASEAEASRGLALLYAGVALALPFLGRAVERFGAKRLYSVSLLAMSLGFAALPAVGWSAHPVAAYYAVTFVLGVPVAGLLVLGRVLISDVIDEDERRTGLRREAMYFGMQGLLTKVSFGVGPLLATQLFAWFGNTAERPLGVLLCGPVAALLGLAGWRAFRHYPLDGAADR
jgi:GPH family glycoside/pentoside/hexuronide:cation symporter